MSQRSSQRDGRGFNRWAPAVLSLCMCAATAWSQAREQPPGGKEVIERFLEVTGGRQAHERVRTRVTSSRIEIPTMGIKGTTKTYLQAPNMAYLEVDLAGAGKEQRGSDGRVFWEMTTNTGPRIFSGQEQEFWKRAFTLDADLHPDRYYKKIENEGTAEVNGKPAWKIALTANDGRAETRYFDQQSGLIVKWEQTVPIMVGEIAVVNEPSDWREVGGINMPFKVIETIQGQVRVNVTIDTAEHNAEIPAETFALPKPIQELAQKPTSAPSGQQK